VDAITQMLGVIITTGKNAGMTYAEKFKATPTEIVGECVRWRGRTFQNEYGKFGALGCEWLAHRVAYVLHYGAIDDSLLILHACDNKWCINPKHMRQGTQQENIDDAVNRKRLNPAFGEAAGKAKLSSIDVSNIVRRYKAGESQTSIHADYPQVSQKQISVVARQLQRKNG